MITETKNEHKVDGDGRQVVELMGSRQFHINTPPTTELEVEPWKLQVWSTVLGASLTTVMPSGDKHSTKVYAGGAVIAVENQGIASMKTADPVTGTVANYVYYDSEFSSSTEEQEPLGQNIWRYDPEDPPEPLPNEPFAGSADWPEWQCEPGQDYYGGFEQMPIHCQQKILGAAGDKLPWSIKSDYDPKEIAPDKRWEEPKSPGAEKSEGELLSRKIKELTGLALGSTSKDQDGDGKCPPDEPCFDLGDVGSVSVKAGGPSPIDMSDTGVVDASVGENGFFDNVSTNADPKIARAVNDTDSILGRNNDCSKFFNELSQSGRESVDAALRKLDKGLVMGIIDPGSNPNKTIGIQMSKPVYGPDFRFFKEVTVNQNGAFFDPFNKVRFGNGFPGFSGYLPDTNKVRVLMILHELAHMVLDKKGEALIPDDGGNQYSGKSKKNTDKILKYCKTEIDKVVD